MQRLFKCDCRGHCLAWLSIAHAALPCQAVRSSNCPVTRSKIIHLLLIKRRPTLYSLGGSHGPVVDVGRSVFEVCSWAPNSEVVPTQISFFSLVELGTQLRCIALHVKLHVCLWKVVSLDIQETFGASWPNFEVGWLDWWNEIFVGLLDCLVWVPVGEESLVGGDEAIRVAFAKLYWRLLRSHIAISLARLVPSTSYSRHLTVSSCILLLLG